MTPKVMKNDIRRYYSRMLMNTINSGDFNHLQSYFSTFMTGSTKFFINYDNFDPTYRIPTRIMADGPKLMSHYFLGIFVMYPDVVMNMNNTVITTSNTWSGTKIEMNVGFNATKIYDLPDGEWIPQLHILEEKCKMLAEEKRNKLIQDSAAWSSDSCVEGNEKGLLERFPSPPSSSSNYYSGAVVRTGSNSGGSAADRFNNFLPTNVDRYVSRSQSSDSARMPDSPASNADEDSTARKKKRLLSALEDTALPSVNTDTVTLPYVSHSNENHISEEYVRVLCAQARPVRAPMEVRMTGTITMFLDANNHIQHMNMTLHQI